MMMVQELFPKMHSCALPSTFRNCFMATEQFISELASIVSEHHHVDGDGDDCARLILSRLRAHPNVSKERAQWATSLYLQVSDMMSMMMNMIMSLSLVFACLY